MFMCPYWSILSYVKIILICSFVPLVGSCLDHMYNYDILLLVHLKHSSYTTCTLIFIGAQTCYLFIAHLMSSDKTSFSLNFVLNVEWMYSFYILIYCGVCIVESLVGVGLWPWAMGFQIGWLMLIIGYILLLSNCYIQEIQRRLCPIFPKKSRLFYLKPNEMGSNRLLNKTYTMLLGLGLAKT